MSLVLLATLTTLPLFETVTGWNATLKAIWKPETFISEPLSNNGATQNFIYITADASDSKSLVQCQLHSTKQLSSQVCNNGNIRIYSGDNHTSGLLIGSFCGEFDTDTFPASDNAMVVVIDGLGLPADTLLKVTFFTTTRCRSTMLASTSPRYVRTPAYPANPASINDEMTNCLWKLEAPSSHRLRMTFSYAANGYTPDCSTTNVTLYDTNSDSFLRYRRHVTTWCGGDDRVFVSFSNYSTIVSEGHRSLQFGLQVEFVAEPVTKCYKDIPVVVGDNGTITSPGYPGSIKQLQVCKWNIRAIYKEVIKLTVMDMDLEYTPNCTKDSVRAYDGANFRSPYLATWCGNMKPEVEFYTSKLTIEMWTGLNHARPYTGFKLQYQTLNEPQLCRRTVGATTQHQTLTSLDYPSPFPSVKKCVWKISSTRPENVVKLDVLSTDLGGRGDTYCPYGYLMAFEGHEEEHSKMIKRWCSSSHETGHIQSKSHKLLLVFVSRNNAVARKKGFVVRYWIGQYGEVNEATYVSKSVSFPGHPGTYVSGYDAFWNITSAYLVNHIGLRFTDVNVSCHGDAITVYDGGLGEEYRYWRICGSSDRSYFSSTFKLYVRFTTITNKGKGFTMTYKSYFYQGCDTNVRDIYTDRDIESYIFSPGYPSNYFDRARCSWRFISGSSGDQIQLVVHSFNIITNTDTACPSDYVVVYNGHGKSSQKLPRICGQDKTTTIRSHGRYLYVEFYTNEIHTGRGFQLTYKSMPDESEVEVTASSTESDSSGVIIGVVVGFVAVVIACFVFVLIRRRTFARRSNNDSPVVNADPRVENLEMIQRNHVVTPTFEPPPAYSEVENLDPRFKNDNVSPPSYFEALTEGMIQDDNSHVTM